MSTWMPRGRYLVKQCFFLEVSGISQCQGYIYSELNACLQMKGLLSDVTFDMV